MKLNEPGSRWSTKSSVMIYPRLEKETLRKLWRVWFCCCYFVVFCCFFVVVVLLLRGPSLLHNDNNHNVYIALYPCIRAHSAVHYQKYTDSTKKKFGQKYRENTIPKKSVQWTNTSHYAYMQPTNEGKQQRSTDKGHNIWTQTFPNTHTEKKTSSKTAFVHSLSSSARDNPSHPPPSL